MCTVFDNGVLKDDLHEAQKVMDVVLSDMGVFREGLGVSTSKRIRSQLSEELQALVDVHQSVWTRITESSSSGMSIFWLVLGLAAHVSDTLVGTNYCTGVRHRFASYMYDYFKGSMDQVYQRSQRQYPSFDETLAMRRRSAGVSPLFALAE